MSDSVSLPRRRVLQALGSAPMLPLAASLAGLPLVARADLRSSPFGRGESVSYSFGSMAAPSLANPDQMAATYVASTLTRRVGRRHSETYSLGYETFFLTGETVPATGGGTIIAGGYYDINNQPITDSTSPAQRQFFSDCPDGMSLIEMEGARSRRHGCSRIFAVVQFEYVTKNVAGVSMYGKLPSPIAVLTLDQDERTGKLSLVSYHNVDTSSVKGLWITCGASKSPWNTHLSSEEYEPDATLASNAQLQAFSTNLFGDSSRANPYDYGHLPEVTVHLDGTGSIKKHYCLGRISHELVQVMPDERTVLMGDDATNGGLFMFISDRRRDLSAGTLYAAKWTQTSGIGPGAGNISWIKLGHATSAEIKALVDSGIRSSDIMDVKTSDPGDASYTRIRFNGTNNWVKLVSGMEKAAAFLETHRYAALVGASMGFSKMEGTTVNAADKRAYSAMSYIYKSMTDGTTDIKVQGPVAGAVYEHVLAGRQNDSDGHRIDSEWVSVSMSVPEGLAGEDLAVRDALGNSANPDKIANPDNLKYSEEMRTLFIGEDSGNHVNNFLWAYNVDTKTLSRILSCPAGAESTGLHAVDDVNGFSYIMSNFQHPGDWESPLHDVVKGVLEPLEKANYNGKFSAAVGYLTITGRTKDV
ncbi:MAG: PhoX family phosphatase [Steroidobacteraceae bacterium]